VADVVDGENRGRMMSGIRGTNTKPEMVVRRMLFALGYRFRVHRCNLPGAPDIVMPKFRVAIFVHVCFLHLHKGCKYSKIPSSRATYWEVKLNENVCRDGSAIKMISSKSPESRLHKEF
jgi:DNA mismatch endonuclease (patch repair protein)